MGKRILWLTETYPPQRGGMAQSCDRIVSGLRERGLTVDVLHFTVQAKSTIPVQQHGGEYLTVGMADSEAHTLNMAWTQIQRWGSWDAVVAFGGNLPVWGGPVFSKWLGAPLVTCLRGNDFDTAIFTPRKRDMLEAALRASATVATVSSEKAWKVEQLYPEVKARFVANGIDLGDWQPTPKEQEFAQTWKAQEAPEKLVLGVIGQLKAKKGLSFLLESLRHYEVAEKIHLLLIGELAEDVSALLETTRCTYSVLPFLDRYELLKYYPCCDGICIPSYYDGMPNVLLEAGGLGVPILASDVDGMHDVLHVIAPQLLFDPGDEHGLRKVIFEWAQAQDEERKAWGLTLRNHIATHYSHQQELDAYEDLFATL